MGVYIFPEALDKNEVACQRPETRDDSVLHGDDPQYFDEVGGERTLHVEPPHGGKGDRAFSLKIERKP